MPNTLTPKQQAMQDLFDRHVRAELDGDLDTTMATMTDNPHLINIPNDMGGLDRPGVKHFYQHHLVGKFFPPDIEMLPISRTIGETQIVDELVLKFTHTVAIEWMLPGVAPTGKPVMVPIVVIVGVQDDKVAYEHIYWDQASVLNQIGLIDAKDLPICGTETAKKLISLGKWTTKTHPWQNHKIPS